MRLWRNAYICFSLPNYGDTERYESKEVPAVLQRKIQTFKLWVHEIKPSIWVKIVNLKLPQTNCYYYQVTSSWCRNLNQFVRSKYKWQTDKFSLSESLKIGVKVIESWCPSQTNLVFILVVRAISSAGQPNEILLGIFLKLSEMRRKQYSAQNPIKTDCLPPLGQKSGL